MKKEKAERGALGIRFVFLGCIFLCNPNVFSIDVLPDIIGVLLIIKGIRVAADLNGYTGDARRGFISAAAVSAARTVLNCLFFVFDGTWLLIFSLAFGILELVFLLPAFRLMFNGLSRTELSVSDTEKNPSDGVSGLTVFFLAVRAACDFLPQLTVLENEYGEVASGGVKTSGTLRVVLIVFCAAFALVLGLVWLSAMKKYISGIDENKAVNSELYGRYEKEILSDARLTEERRRKSFTMLTVTAFLLFISLRFESVYIIPEFTAGILLAAACRRGGKYLSQADSVFRKAIAFSAVSAVGYLFMILYAVFFGGFDSPQAEDGFYMLYIPYVVAAVLSYILLVCISRDIRSYYDSLIKGELSSIQPSGERAAAAYGSIRNELIVKIRRTYAIQVTYSAVSAVCVAATPFFPMLWAFKFVSGIVMIISVYASSEAVENEIKKKTL